MRLNALSQTTTGPAQPPDSSHRVQPWMYPKILEDLTKGAQAQQSNLVLSREAALLKFRHSADSSLIAGLRTDNRLQARRIETLIDSSGRGWQMATYWHGRYRRADRERWLLRGGFGLFLLLQRR